MPCWVLHLDSTSAVGDIHVFHVILLKICYVISDKQKYISLVVVVVVIVWDFLCWSILLYPVYVQKVSNLSQVGTCSNFLLSKPWQPDPKNMLFNIKYAKQACWLALRMDYLLFN